MIIQKRLFLGRFTVADSTALQPEARHKLRTLSRYYGYFGCLLIFNIPPEICLERNKSRHRSVEERVIPYHTGLLQRTILDAPQEGWEAIHILDEQSLDVKIEFENV